MIHRRLLAAAFSIALLLPTALSGAIALHVAFDHRHEGDRASGAEHALTEGVSEHGDAISADPRPHGHAAALIGTGVIARRVIAAGSDGTAVGPAPRIFRPVLRHPGAIPRASTGPPKIGGRPLRHRFSILHI